MKTEYAVVNISPENNEWNKRALELVRQEQTLWVGRPGEMKLDRVSRDHIVAFYRDRIDHFKAKAFFSKTKQVWRDIESVLRDLESLTDDCASAPEKSYEMIGFLKGSLWRMDAYILQDKARE